MFFRVVASSLTRFKDVSVLGKQSLRAGHTLSDVNKDLTFKDKDNDTDQTLKAKDQDKDQTPKDKDHTFKAKDQDKD